ncbi:hypothetical protein RRG08_012161 [Elysia crispata]|uniref:Uncharacterized protein n=1 Tax=Elysia crispata TaxID=231223 RepID=A0AAE0ZJE3_9GAST|nr:hypothetical protein RRG08_012161 [Elysia crispata]
MSPSGATTTTELNQVKSTKNPKHNMGEFNLAHRRERLNSFVVWLSTESELMLPANRGSNMSSTEGMMSTVGVGTAR